MAIISSSMDLHPVTSKPPLNLLSSSPTICPSPTHWQPSPAWTLAFSFLPSLLPYLVFCLSHPSSFCPPHPCVLLSRLLLSSLLVPSSRRLPIPSQLPAVLSAYASVSAFFLPSLSPALHFPTQPHTLHDTCLPHHRLSHEPPPFSSLCCVPSLLPATLPTLLPYSRYPFSPPACC